MSDTREQQEQTIDRLLAEGVVCRQQADFDGSRRAAQAALTCAESLQDAARMATSLNNLGNVCCCLGQFKQAWDYHSRALALWEQVGSARKIASTLNNLGLICCDTGQYEQALDYYLRALALFEQQGDKQGIGMILSNLGHVYSDLGQHSQAVDCLTRALLVAEQDGDASWIALNLNNLGNVHGYQGEFEPAERYYTRALALFERVGSAQDIATSLGNLGGVYSGLGQYEQALEYHTRSLAMRERIGNAQQIALGLCEHGLTYDHLGQSEQALECYARALALLGPLGNEQDTAMCLTHLGETYQRLGRLDEAEESYRDALQKYEAVGEQVGEASEVGDFQQANQKGTYARYALLCVRRGHPEQALALVERGRAQGLARQTADNNADLARLTSPEDAAQWAEARQALSLAERQGGRARRRLSEAADADRGAAQAEADHARQEQEAAERRIALLRADLYRRFPDYRRLRGASPPTWEGLAGLARRNPDTLYLEYTLVDDETTLLFALSDRDGLQAFVLDAGHKALAEKVQAWRTSLQNPAAAPPGERQDAYRHAGQEPERARELSRLLLGGLETAGLLPNSRFTRLAVVADGPLRDVPFAALLDADGLRLIERYAVSLSLSLGVLTWPQNPRRPSATFLAAADPCAPTGGYDDQPVRAAAVRGEDVPLPQAREEAREVAALFGDALVLIGEEAREAEIKRRMPEYALLHFATHGKLLCPGMRSWLMLAPEPLDSPEDGLLEARDIAGMTLSARLATLSACETGRGQQSGGEGLLGLAWAFRAAGCPSVVASQWQVDDAATKELMVAFYQWLRAGERMDDALRRAMLHVRSAPHHAHAYYWAGFQLLGETAPLPGLSKSQTDSVPAFAS